MFLFSPHYPWYIIWLIPFFTLQPNLPILTYLMAFFYLFTTYLADGSIPNLYIINKRLYAAVAIAARPPTRITQSHPSRSKLPSAVNRDPS